jgi:hypothetical protein
MPTPVIIKIGEIKLSAELNDSPSAEKLRLLFPIEFSMSRWEGILWKRNLNVLGAGLSSYL